MTLYRPGSTGPWECNDPGIYANGFIHPLFSAYRDSDNAGGWTANGESGGYSPAFVDGNVHSWQGTTTG